MEYGTWTLQILKFHWIFFESSIDLRSTPRWPPIAFPKTLAWRPWPRCRPRMMRKGLQLLVSFRCVGNLWKSGRKKNMFCKGSINWTHGIFQVSRCRGFQVVPLPWPSREVQLRALRQITGRAFGEGLWWRLHSSYDVVSWKQHYASLIPVIQWMATHHYSKLLCFWKIFKKYTWVIVHMATGMHMQSAWVLSVAGSFTSDFVGLDGGFKTLMCAVKAWKLTRKVSGAWNHQPNDGLGSLRANFKWM